MTTTMIMMKATITMPMLIMMTMLTTMFWLMIIGVDAAMWVVWGKDEGEGGVIKFNKSWLLLSIHMYNILLWHATYSFK